MRRKLIAGFVALAAVGGAGFAAGSALSGTDDDPEYTPLTVDLGRGTDAVRTKTTADRAARPRLIYLASSKRLTVNTADVGTPDPNPADPTDDPVGPYVDLELSGCSKVVTGGVRPVGVNSTDAYIQGSYVESPRIFHVLVGLDDAAAEATPRPTFQVTTNLTCLKGVK